MKDQAKRGYMLRTCLRRGLWRRGYLCLALSANDVDEIARERGIAAVEEVLVVGVVESHVEEREA